MGHIPRFARFLNRMFSFSLTAGQWVCSASHCCITSKRLCWYSTHNCLCMLLPSYSPSRTWTQCSCDDNSSRSRVCMCLYECVQPRIEWANVSSVYVLGDVIGVCVYICAHYTFIPNSMNGWAGKSVRCESCSLCLLVVSCHNLTFTKPYDSNIYSDIHTNNTNATEMSCWFGEHAFVWDKHAYTKFCL